MEYLKLDPYRVYNEIDRYFGGRCVVVIKKNTIKVVVRPAYSGIEKKIFEDIYNYYNKRLPKVYVQKSIDGNIGKLRLNQYNPISIRVTLPKSIKQSSVLKPGEPYELYFKSVILDGLVYLKELREELEMPPKTFDEIFNLTLNLYGGGKKFSIGNIKEVEKVGQLALKPDVIVTQKTGKKVSISLKQGNFSFYSSANDEKKIGKYPMEVLENTINSGKVEVIAENGRYKFSNNVNGIRIPATREQVKKFCFGGRFGVDYIVINAKKTNFNKRTNVISMEGMNIFKNNNEADVMRLLPDVYMVISQDPRSNASSMGKYKGFSVDFINKKKAYDPKNNYIDAAAISYRVPTQSNQLSLDFNIR
jgi:hypothetical protein